MFDGNQTSFNIDPTSCNIVQHGGQTSATCWIQQCWMMVHPFGRAFTPVYFLAAVDIVAPLLVIPIIFLSFSIHLHYFHSNNNGRPSFQHQGTLTRVYCGKTNSVNPSIVIVFIYDTSSSLSDCSKNIGKGKGNVPLRT